MGSDTGSVLISTHPESKGPCPPPSAQPIRFHRSPSPGEEQESLVSCFATCCASEARPWNCQGRRVNRPREPCAAPPCEKGDTDLPERFGDSAATLYCFLLFQENFRPTQMKPRRNLILTFPPRERKKEVILSRAAKAKRESRGNKGEAPFKSPAHPSSYSYLKRSPQNSRNPLRG